MNNLVAYHRPASVPEAIELLSNAGRIVLAGGTSIRHDGGARAVEVVDLQSLGLTEVQLDQGRIVIGAMNTLQAIVDHGDMPEAVRAAARAELPSALRTLGTVGGSIGVADRDSLFLTALLAYDASVRFADDRDVALADVLRDGLAENDLILAITIDATGRGAIVRTGRTPADTPIVAAVARSTSAGVTLALGGVAAHPVIVEPDAVGDLEPPADFRGSTVYRRHLAGVLAARAIEELS